MPLVRWGHVSRRASLNLGCTIDGRQFQGPPMSITVSSMSTIASSIQALSSAGTSASTSNGAASGTASTDATAAAGTAYMPEAAIVATLGGSGSRVQV